MGGNVRKNKYRDEEICNGYYEEKDNREEDMQNPACDWFSTAAACDWNSVYATFLPQDGVPLHKKKSFYKKKNFFLKKLLLFVSLLIKKKCPNGVP